MPLMPNVPFIVRTARSQAGIGALQFFWDKSEHRPYTIAEQTTSDLAKSNPTLRAAGSLSVMGSVPRSWPNESRKLPIKPRS
jgi:hypothetical protein